MLYTGTPNVQLFCTQGPLMYKYLSTRGPPNVQIFQYTGTPNVQSFSTQGPLMYNY